MGQGQPWLPWTHLECPHVQHHHPRDTFVIPNNPDLHPPNHGGTVAQITQTLCEHNENLQQQKEYSNVLENSSSLSS